MARAVSFKQFAEVCLSVVKLAAIGVLLYIIAIILAIAGKREQLRKSHAWLRSHGLLPSVTQEDRNEAWIRKITWHLRLRGLSWPRTFLVAVVYFARGKRMGFLNDELAELRKSLGPNLTMKQLEKDDFGLVISATSMLDQLLGFALVIRFPVDLTKSSYERIFSPNGPLGTFSAKISLASVLGLTVGEMWNDLSILRKLRNDYAHAILPRPLTDKEMSQRCLSLRLRLPLSEDTIKACKTIERQRVIESVNSITLALVILIHRLVAERQVLADEQAQINTKMRAALNEMGMPLRDTPATSSGKSA